MSNIVLVTSAIYTNYGIYDTDTRIDQTIKSLDSIKKYIPNPFIIFVDNSKIDQIRDKNKDFDSIIDKVDYFVDNSADNNIKYFHENVSNYDIGKNVMECLGMRSALYHIYDNQVLYNKLMESSRIFKISGRYEVHEGFDDAMYHHDGKYVFKKSNDAWIDSTVTGVDKQLQTRLWSFDHSLFFETIVIFEKIINNMIGTINAGKYIDIEHSMYKFIPKDKLVELDVVGVKGNIAPNGAAIIE